MRFDEPKIRARVWLLFAAVAAAAGIWIDSAVDLERKARKPRVTVREEPSPEVPYWGGGPSTTAVTPPTTDVPAQWPSWMSEAAEPPPREEPLASAVDAGGEVEPTIEADAAARTTADAEPPEADLDAAEAEPATDAAPPEDAGDASPELLAMADAGVAWDPNAPVIVPLYTPVPIELPPISTPPPTLGGTSIGAAGAGGSPIGSGGAGGSTIGGAGAGGTFGAGVHAAGGTAVGSAGAISTSAAGGFAPFGGAPVTPLSASPFNAPVTVILTPFGWFVVPLFPVANP